MPYYPGPGTLRDVVYRRLLNAQKRVKSWSRYIEQMEGFEKREAEGVETIMSRDPTGFRHKLTHYKNQFAIAEAERLMAEAYLVANPPTKEDGDYR